MIPKLFFAVAFLVRMSMGSPSDAFLKTMDKARANELRSRLQKQLLEKAVPVPVPDSGRLLEDGANDDANNNDNGLDLKDYALKYVGCQNVKSWSDNLAEDADSTSVLGLERFVIFRLCNAELCSSYNKYGCNQDYGEFMIEMEYYLEAMASYHYDRYSQYCATCQQCMTSQDDDGAAVYNNTDDQVNDGNATSWSAETDCEFYDACENYKEACYQYASGETQYEDFFTCTEFEVGNNVAYLGPHCSGDGKTIQIGIFDDDECKSYLGDMVDLQQFTGMTFEDDGLAFYDSGSCISCISEVRLDGGFVSCPYLCESLAT